MPASPTHPTSCHYTGRLASNGKVFDSSYERGRPLTFKVRRAEHAFDQSTPSALPPSMQIADSPLPPLPT